MVFVCSKYEAPKMPFNSKCFFRYLFYFMKINFHSALQLLYAKQLWNGFQQHSFHFVPLLFFILLFYTQTSRHLNGDNTTCLWHVFAYVRIDFKYAVAKCKNNPKQQKNKWVQQVVVGCYGSVYSDCVYKPCSNTIFICPQGIQIVFIFI